MLQCRDWYDPGIRSPEPLRSFVDRLLSPVRPEAVIPYRSLILLYDRATNREAQTDLPRCSCGCGRAVIGRRKFYDGTCRTRAFRKVTDPSKRRLEPARIKDPSVTNRTSDYTQRTRSLLRYRGSPFPSASDLRGGRHERSAARTVK